MTTPITLNAARQQFELPLDGELAYVAYEREGSSIAYTHTIVPPAIGGRGVGSQLARHVLDYAAEHGLRVVPACSFIRSYIAKHPQYQALVAPRA